MLNFSLLPKKPLKANLPSITDASKIAKFLAFAKSEKLQINFNGKPLNLNIKIILNNA